MARRWSGLPLPPASPASGPRAAIPSLLVLALAATCSVSFGEGARLDIRNIREEFTTLAAEAAKGEQYITDRRTHDAALAHAFNRTVRRGKRGRRQAKGSRRRRKASGSGRVRRGAQDFDLEGFLTGQHGKSKNAGGKKHFGASKNSSGGSSAPALKASGSGRVRRGEKDFDLEGFLKGQHGESKSKKAGGRKHVGASKNSSGRSAAPALKAADSSSKRPVVVDPPSRRPAGLNYDNVDDFLRKDDKPTTKNHGIVGQRSKRPTPKSRRVKKPPRTKNRKRRKRSQLLRPVTLEPISTKRRK